jgi:hypothetical protein
LWFYDNNSTMSSSTTAATMPHPIKAKFSSFKSWLLFTFTTPDTQRLLHEKSSCISFRKITKALVAGVPCRILDNLVYSRRARLTVGKAQTLGVRLMKRLSKYLEIQMRQTRHITSDLSSWSSREVHQANERILRTSNKIAQKILSFYFAYYIIITIWKRNISLRDKVFHNYSYFLQESTKSSSPSTWVKILRVVQLESMPGYKYPNIDSGATPIGSADRTPDEDLLWEDHQWRARKKILSPLSVASTKK